MCSVRLRFAQIYGWFQYIDAYYVVAQLQSREELFHLDLECIAISRFDFIYKKNLMTPPPFLSTVYCFFKPAYCVRPYFGLAYCELFNNKNNLLALPLTQKRYIKQQHNLWHAHSCKL